MSESNNNAPSANASASASQKQFFMNCRATAIDGYPGAHSCGGRTAELVSIADLPFNNGGGRIITYKCCSCGGVWTIQTCG